MPKGNSAALFITPTQIEWYERHLAAMDSLSKVIKCVRRYTEPRTTFVRTKFFCVRNIAEAKAAAENNLGQAYHIEVLHSRQGVHLSVQRPYED